MVIQNPYIAGRQLGPWLVLGLAEASAGPSSKSRKLVQCLAPPRYILDQPMHNDDGGEDGVLVAMRVIHHLAGFTKDSATARRQAAAPHLLKSYLKSYILYSFVDLSGLNHKISKAG